MTCQSLSRLVQIKPQLRASVQWWADDKQVAWWQRQSRCGWCRQSSGKHTQTQTHSSSVLFVLGMLYLHSNPLFFHSVMLRFTVIIKKNKTKHTKNTFQDENVWNKVCTSIQTFKGIFSAECQRIVFLNLPLRVKSQCMACSCKTNSDATPGCPSLPPHLYKAGPLGRCAASSWQQPPASPPARSSPCSPPWHLSLLVATSQSTNL